MLGLVAAVAAVAFPLAPVQQPAVEYGWTAADGPAAIPLMPYQPVSLTASTSCAAVREAGDGVVLSTTPLNPDPAADRLYGLRLAGNSPFGLPAPDAQRRPTGALLVSSAGVDLGEVALPAGQCAISVVSDPARTEVLVDGAPVLTRDGDVRPDVAGAFSDLPDGVSLALTADTRFQTTISPLKAAIAVIGVLALLGALVALAGADRAVTRPVRLLPRRWWVPRATDLVVASGLGVWWLVGAITVDDGYIAGIVRGRGDNGFIGNVYRWLNAPEAPFSWFYDIYYPWSLISPSTPWMRLPSVLLGLLCWVLLSRFALPRLGRVAHRWWVGWVAALGLLTWWVPLNVGLRPEPWVAVGGLAVFLAVERALAIRRLLPVAVGLVVAAATTAVTPGGLLAFAPFLAAAVPLLRLLRARRDLAPWALVAALVAAPASAVFLMTYDQSLGGLLEATRVRALIGGGVEWYQEFERYSTLLEAGSFQASIGRRAAVLVTLLAAFALLWALGRPARTEVGIATGPARRITVGFLLMLALMTLSPTKWTQHFGGVAGVGAAVLVLGAAVGTAAALRSRPRALVVGLAAATGVGVLVISGRNLWPYVGDLFTPTFSTLPPRVAGIPLATVLGVAGGALVLALAARSAWWRSGGHGTAPVPHRVPGPAPVLTVVLVLVLALQVGSFARIAVTHRDSYTLASDALATAGGEPCGLQRVLSVETDPAAGLLPTADGGPPAPRLLPTDVGGVPVPGTAVAGRLTTAWFTLDPEQTAGRLPVVVTTSGATRTGDGLYLEFGADGEPTERRRIGADGTESADHRQLAPAGATDVRLVVDAPTAGPRIPAVVSLPRVPRLTPMTELLPPGSTALLDWPVAFLFPCLRPAPLPDGTASLPQWRVAPPAGDPAAGITYAAGFGGPYTASRLLVTEQRMATYLRGAPLSDTAQLLRWTPVTPLATPAPTITDRTVPGWQREGHARVPGLDPVG